MEESITSEVKPETNVVSLIYGGRYILGKGLQRGSSKVIKPGIRELQTRLAFSTNNSETVFRNLFRDFTILQYNGQDLFDYAAQESPNRGIVIDSQPRSWMIGGSCLEHRGVGSIEAYRRARPLSESEVLLSKEYLHNNLSLQKKETRKELIALLDEFL